MDASIRYVSSALLCLTCAQACRIAASVELPQRFTSQRIHDARKKRLWGVNAHTQAGHSTTRQGPRMAGSLRNAMHSDCWSRYGFATSEMLGSALECLWPTHKVPCATRLALAATLRHSKQQLLSVAVDRLASSSGLSKARSMFGMAKQPDVRETRQRLPSEVQH